MEINSQNLQGQRNNNQVNKTIQKRVALNIIAEVRQNKSKT